MRLLLSLMESQKRGSGLCMGAEILHFDVSFFNPIGESKSEKSKIA